MDKLIKLIILAGVIYGIFWVYQNVDFNQLVNETNKKIEQEKTVTRVIDGRQNAIKDTQNVLK